MTLEKEKGQYLKWMPTVNRSHETVKLHDSALREFLNYLKDYHNIISPDQITVVHMHGYQAYLKARQTKKGLPLKSSTINRRIAGVKGFLEYLFEKGLVFQKLDTTVNYIKEPKILPTSVLNHAQVTALSDAIDTTTLAGMRDRTVVELLYSCGIRIGELESLTIYDIYFDISTVKVQGKGNKERMVPVGKTALRLLEGYLRAVRPFMLNPRFDSRDALFLNHHGRPLRGFRVRDYLHQYAHKAGLDINVTPHTFRRSCATEMIKGNANIYHVKEILGHESLTTLRHYVKLNINDLRDTHARCHPREQE